MPNIGSTWWIVEAGHYELCMEVEDANVGLSSACYNDHIDIVQLMIAKGASDWNRGLSGACRYGYMDIVQLMIAKGATTCSICDNSKHAFTS
jgi:ankyrin repeat protein